MPATTPTGADVLAGDSVTLVRVQAGIRIAELNAYLESRKLALANMGGFDGQTVAGVISTSTHGSGIGFGPLSDLVRSLDIVGPDGAVCRIEPADGPTDPDAYRRATPSTGCARTMSGSTRRSSAWAAWA